MVDFRKLFREVHARRRMFVSDDRYVTVVAFVEGCDSATGGNLLNGFNEWLSLRMGTSPSSLIWSTQVANKYGFTSDMNVSLEQQEEVIDDLFRILDEFLAERSDRDGY